MEYHLKKPFWQRGDTNLRRWCQLTALLSTRLYKLMDKIKEPIHFVSNNCTGYKGT